MARYKCLNGEMVQLTETEETERDSQENVELDNLPNYKRQERNELLEMNVDPIASNALRWNDMTDAKRTEWTNYRQALLDVPEQSGFPNDITWPTKP